MLFPTFDFAIFFAIVFVGNWLLRPFPVRWKAFILTASYVFYGWWDWRFVALLAASTAVTTIGAVGVDRVTRDGYRRAVLVATVTLELGLLGWFKYYGFVSLTVDNAFHRLGVASLPLPLLQVTLPVGISFFTFMGLSYVIDVYRGVLAPAPAIDVAVYVAFFPHLIAGPIVRGSDLLPQIAHATRRNPRRIDFSDAAYLLFGGLFKKVVVASYVSTAIVNPVYDNPGAHSAPEILLATYGFAVQIYCDFSGYTDIAIGCALLLGFRFPKNFDDPYRARSLQDFWRRWHMTLSSWLRDYLYVPLGGSRGSQLATYGNIIITMVLGGLWHGAAWTFVCWGAFHGVGQVVGHYRRDRRVARGAPLLPDTPARRGVERFVTFNLVSLGWLFFRAHTIGQAFTLLRRLVLDWGGPAPLVRAPVVLAILGALAIQYVPKEVGASVRRGFSALNVPAKGIALGASLVLITTLGPPGVPPFIYFRF